VAAFDSTYATHEQLPPKSRFDAPTGCDGNYVRLLHASKENANMASLDRGVVVRRKYPVKPMAWLRFGSLLVHLAGSGGGSTKGRGRWFFLFGV
jgi:hypothetical protein